nr:immunoglobulin light chain junction region [Macaca mulatta]MOW61673.1 immunoglobulin light chain junction region [Macaca mulatta]MOW61746.1 immunoglobulin light chain junction region [Macaca mulatta]MOW61791.1 immunoglobulin light chain junction region [Macaca mulatta]MOW61931.1 immunoglobulin light chain junction region [Macaca mulatta]
CLQDLQFPLTF